MNSLKLQGTKSIYKNLLYFYTMTKNIRKNENEMMDMRLMAENCNCSIYTMGAVAAGILFCIGIILYALIAG